MGVVRVHIWWWCSAAVLFPFGVFALVKPEKIQEWVIRKGDHFPFQDYVESPAYVVQQRIAGAVAIAMALFLAYAAYANP